MAQDTPPVGGTEAVPLYTCAHCEWWVTIHCGTWFHATGPHQGENGCAGQQVGGGRAWPELALPPNAEWHQRRAAMLLDDAHNGWFTAFDDLFTTLAAAHAHAQLAQAIPATDLNTAL